MISVTHEYKETGMAAPSRVMFEDFPSTFRGQIFRPGDDGYADARVVWNARLADDEPTLIARAADIDDVITVVGYAAQQGIGLAVKSGGHDVDCMSTPDGALVLDMARFKDISVDAETGRVRLGSGVLLGEMDTALAEKGLVVPSGTVSTTGVAGLVLGGGVGFNMRRYGATVDSLLACDVVTADGRVVRASQEENPDLFWALRGGGGNFGVVTHFEFQAHPVPETVLGGMIPFSIDQAPAVLENLRSFVPTAPRELALVGVLTQCPPLPDVPPEMHGAAAVMLVAIYTGPQENYDALSAQLASLGDPAAVALTPAPWWAINRMMDVVAPPGRRVRTKGGYLADLTDEAITTAIEHAKRAPQPTNPFVPSTNINFWAMGGAISNDFLEASAAFSRAGVGWFCEWVTQCDLPEQEQDFTKWSDDLYADLKPHLMTSCYINLSSDLGAQWRQGAWGAPDRYQKLVDIKTKWDPTNMFRFNKNIEPKA
jgi:FAD/FMN-containing dehydrogenase